MPFYCMSKLTRSLSGSLQDSRKTNGVKNGVLKPAGDKNKKARLGEVEDKMAAE